MDSRLIRPATSQSSIQVFGFHNDLGKSVEFLLSLLKYKYRSDSTPPPRDSDCIP